MSDTPETDAFCARYSHHFPNWLAGEFLACARRLERERDEARQERDALAERFTALDKPKHSGNPMMDAVLGTPNPAFRAWVASLPTTYWTRYDLSAARIGWEAAITEMKAERDELLEWKRQAMDVLHDIARLPVAAGYVDGPCLDRSDMNDVIAVITKAEGKKS